MNLENAVAVVGFGCRYPGGVNDASSFLDLLHDRRVAVRPPPSERWNMERYFGTETSGPARMYTREAGFLNESVKRFDAEIFGISPREAHAMDPQQRVMLEVTVEALENAGLNPWRLSGTRTGVYCGAMAVDYQNLLMRTANTHLVDTHTALGMTLGVIANRISHAFDLNGPSLSIDTACSASLTALHYACRDIRSGEAELAICGGINLILMPEFMMALCRGQFLGPNGRSLPFDARANGFGRGEGAGVVVLKKADQAMADADPIMGLILDSRINQDGRTNGMSRPNGDAQKQLMHELYSQAGLNPSDASFVEAHGTGTVVGDAIEAEAIGTVFGAGRRADDPVLIGTLKGNIGHLEAGAGIAAVIKALLSLDQGILPAHPSLEQLRTDIDFRGLNIAVSAYDEALAKRSNLRFAGVNGFGYGGTNVHLILAEAPESTKVEKPAVNPSLKSSVTAPQVIMLSGRDQAELQREAKSIAAHLEATKHSTADVARGSACLRPPNRFRAAVQGVSHQDLLDRLTCLAEGEEAPGIITGQGGNKVKPVFVFNGMGAQYPGMAAGLLETEPAFATAAREVEQLFQDRWQVSPLSILFDDTADPTAVDTQQWSNFIVQVSLLRMLQDWGVQPAAVIGHSAGDSIAALAAGVITLEEASAIVYHRVRLMRRLAGHGGMLAAALTVEEAQSHTRRIGGLDIAAINSPRLITISGHLDSLNHLFHDLETSGVFVRRIQVDVPYHSHLIEEICTEYTNALSSVVPKPSGMPWISTVYPDQAHSVADGTYWADNARLPVRFSAALDKLLDLGHRHFLQIGPHPALAGAMAEIASVRNEHILCTATLTRKQSALCAVAELRAQLYIQGMTADWERVQHKGRRVHGALPLRNWAGETYFTESAKSAIERLAPKAHELLGDREDGPGRHWRSVLSPTTPAFLSGHKVRNRVVVPAAVYIETAIAAIRSETVRQVRLENLTFSSPLILKQNDHVHLTTRWEPDGSIIVQSTSYPSYPGSEWKTHANLHGNVIDNVVASSHPGWSLKKPKTICVDAFYRRLEDFGLSYTGGFQAIKALRVDGNCAEADLSPPQPDMVLDPCLLDGAWQAALVLMDEPRLLLPQSVSSVTLLSPITEAVSARILARSTADAIELIVDVDLISSDGSVLARVEGLVCAEPPAPANSVDLDLYRSTWSTQTVSELPSTSHRWLLYGKDEASISMLAQHAPVGIDIVNTIKDVERHVSDGAERIVVLADSQQEDPEIHLLDLITLLNAIPDEMNNLRLIVVTRASFALMSGDVISANGHRALWGAVRAIRWERPDWKIDLYDLPDRITSLDGKQFWHACIEGLSSEGAIRNTRLLRHDLDHLRQTDIDSSTARISRSSIQTPLQLDLSGPRPVWRRLPHHVATVGDLRILAVTPAPGFPGRYDALATSAVDDTLLAVCGSEELLASGINRSKIKVSCPIDLPLQSRKPLPMTALSRIEYLRTRLAPGAPVSLELPDGLSLRFLVAFLTAHGHPVYQIGTAPVQFSGSNNMIEFLSRDRLETLTRLSYLAEQGAIYVTSKPDEGWMGSSLARRGYAVAALSETPETAPGSLSPLLTSQGRPDDDLPSGIEQSTNVICPWDRPLLTQGASSLLSPVIGGCCLITGGVSGVGAALAKTMARQGHQNLVLVGRRGPQTPGTSSLISELQQLGATPRIEACDVSDASAVLDLLKRIGPVKTVIHAAGAVIDCSMDQTSAEVVRTAFAAKVNGAKNLKAATAASPPDCMVLIGSLTASVGNRNQVAYASANACLEELADLWRQADESSMVLCFAPGAISDTGTVAQSKAIAARLDKLGISNISVKQIHDRLNLLTHDGNTISCAIFAAIDWSQWAPKVDPRSPLYRLIVSKKGAYHNKKNSEVSFTASEMALVLCNALAAVLRADPASLDTDKPLNTFGIDSLMSVSIALELEQATGVSCDPLDILAARSINELADTLSIRGQRKDGPPSEVREPQFVST